MRIGDILLRLLADDSGFEADVVKKADAAGIAGEKSLGARLASGFKSNAIKAFGVVASAAFGVAAVGAAKLADVQARFRAETGASAEEAAAAAKTINRVAGDERMSLEQVSDIAIKVRRDLGAVGPQADALTAKIAKFARVTRQDGGQAVSDIDDLVDAWGVSLEDVGGLLDKLIVSGQKWGGSITEDQKALAAMAPQLKAFNLGIDDGIALLDLFKASGLDAAQVPRALNSALQKLNGESLPDFIRELSSIEDPTRRAQRAIEVFGSRAGAQLANAIKPGMTSLADLGITAEESAGALDKAGDALDSTFGARLQKLLSQAGAKLRQFGADFGPLVTGAASLASLGGALGLDKVLANGFDGLRKSPLVKEAASTAGAAISGALTTAFELAEKLVHATTEGLEAIAEKLGVKAAAAKAGTIIGGVFEAAFATGERFAGAAAGALLKIPGVRQVVTAAEKAGAFLGTRFGTAFSAAAAIGIALLVPEALDAITPNEAGRIAGQFGSDFADSLADATIEQLKAKRAEVLKAYTQALALPEGFDPLRPLKNLFGPDNIFGSTPEQDLKELLDKIDADIAAWEAQHQQQPSPLESGVFLGPPIPDALLRKRGEEAVAQVLNGASGAIRHGGTGVVDQLARALSLGPAQLVQMTTDARQSMAKVIGAAADGIRSRRAAIDSALSQLRDDIKNQLSPKKEVALRIGQLFTKTLVRGLHSADAEVKAQAEYTRALIEDQLIELVKAGGPAGQKVLDELRDKMHSKNPQVRDQAKRTKAVIDAALKDPSGGKTPGDKIGDDLAADIKSKGPIVGREAYNLGVLIARNIRAGVHQSGPLLPSGGGSGGSAPKVGGPKQFDQGTWNVPGDQFAFVHDREIIVPQAESDAIRAGSAVLAGSPQAAGADGGDTFNLYLPDARHVDPWAVLDRVPRYAKLAKAAAGDGGGWKAA